MRILIVVAVALAVGMFGSQTPRFWLRAQLLYFQHQCLRFTFSPNQIVLSMPEVHQMSLSVAGLVQPPWKSLYTLMSRPGMQSNATAFLHELISPAGHHRLVAINIHLYMNHRVVFCGTRVIAEGSVDSDPKEVIVGNELHQLSLGDGPIRIFGGVADPADSSHFTFIVEDGPNHDEMNGWLLDDDHVRLEFHQNPSTQPVPASPASSQ
jgi:hypothetical protein